MKEMIGQWRALPEENTGRQKELDDAKGFLLIAIVLIHAYQAFGNELSRESSFYKVLFGSFMVTGACLYLFSMGFGIAYTKRNTAADLGKNGIRLLVYQLFSNICYALATVLPFLLWSLTGTVPEGTREIVLLMTKGFLLFFNIFFIAGMIYLVMALLKSLRTPLWCYLVIGIATSVLSPVFARFTTGARWADLLLDVTFGSIGNVSFCFFPYISFVCAGYVMGMVLRKVKDKAAFYRKGSILTGAILLVAAVCFFWKYPELDQRFRWLEREYLIAGFVKFVVSDAAIFLLLSFFYFLNPILEKWAWLTGKIRYIAKHISKYYAIHIGVYIACSVFTGYQGAGSLGCLGCFLVVMPVTDLIVKIYEKLRSQSCTNPSLSK